ncbi:aspartate kinase [Roseibium hamelinense]|uniref:aspartate kinase n=1 Tax=Roseibium hamelinense TaxID=150831 RepID=A0A562TJ18_9HYPH|nr:aspartate kinase [Roseibium hamelinense]MTI46147.1 aspartate kinase [Roseibium hamelinense]TWI92660.1 aspartate kinase [Roseibium hamelinense]
MAPTVIKFGGSSFADPEGFHRVAAYVMNAQARGKDMVVVVSAPPNLTESWRKLLTDVNPKPKEQTTGGLLPRADTVGAYLLAAAFDAVNAPCRVMPADLLGIETDSVFCNATPKNIDMSRVRQTLAEGKIVVVPGGQARSLSGDLTWLGKNSSDVSAILLAAYLNAEACTICSDVPGVFSADPNTYPDAQLLEEISYEDAIAMSISGAKVLHHRAIEVARNHGVPLELRLNRPPFNTGTTVGPTGKARAVIPDQKSKVFVFPDADTRSSALEVLGSNNLPVIDLAEETGAPVVVTCGFSDPDRILQEARISFSRTDQKILTLLVDGEIERTLCPSPDALEVVARSRHTVLAQAFC